MSNRIILLAHGSSDKHWCQTFEKLAQPTLDAVSGSKIAYMELASPSLDDVIAEEASAGFTSFTIVPLFLAAGRHLRKDVPAMVRGLESTHNVEIQLAPPIGESPEIGNAIRDAVVSHLGTDTG
ncbi:sirohydrochlorin chelatase [Marinobacter sp. F4216]|uniref:sirohydrochlorin chelatase n=1 Tax=Marinobacter sp. F4216 TaxID=2874281 RepID=UPI001CBEB9E2|nr:CbiX/SirB N-terminal domain-containing protein [Marinobacter sp. F4216]MBZ2170035.1 CbiX/SirB N-terminal domain-containing protein [Marinobacter sp. F4216]